MSSITIEAPTSAGRLQADLQTEIDANRKKIYTDSYAMSLGELINMYRDGELAIHPAYQRLFRWSEKQKAKLIDSLLLGIPVPSIFVSQRADGVWELVDGLQRMGTILQLVGILRDEQGQPVTRLRLAAYKNAALAWGQILAGRHG